MTVQMGQNYVHTALGYVNESGEIMFTEDAEQATMVGKYADKSATESTDTADYEWAEIDASVPENSDADGEDDEEVEAAGTNDLLYRTAGTQSKESIQENLVTGTNNGAYGWSASGGTLSAAECSPGDNGAAINGVRWIATANAALSRTASITGEAVPDGVTVSFWWNASAACGLAVSIGANTSERQYNYDNSDLDEDGNYMDLSGAWVMFEALVPIHTTADSYAVAVTTDSAATINLCDFKVEAGDKRTEWTASATEALNTAREAQDSAKQAAKTATNYMNYDADGLLIGNMTADKLGNNVRISPDGVDIRNGGTVLASYGADTIRIGVDDGAGAASTINMNNGSATLKTVYEQTDFGDGDVLEKRFFEMRAKETMAINAPETVDISVKSVLEGDEEASELAQLMLSAQEEFDLTEDGQEISKGVFGSAVLAANDISIVGNDSAYGMDVSIEGRTFVNGEELHPFDSNTYTSFSGGVVSSGTVRVLKKFGWCLVRGSVVLSSAASNWATVLSSSAVPAPQHGDSLRQVCPYWGTSYTRPTIVSIGSSGGLLLRYGAAGSTAYFHFCYPVD